MLCGTRSFSDLDDGSRASSPRPKLSKLKQSLSLDRGRKQISNPYSNEGLDKFEKLVAELEAKKEEVLLKKRKKKVEGSDQDMSTTVRFKYNSDTGDWIPIIVRLQPPAEAKKKKKKESISKEKPIQAASSSSEEETEETKEVMMIIKQVAGEKKKSINVQQFWAVMMMVVVVVVLVSCCFLLIGRAFVVCSATILWYVVPMVNISEVGSGISWDWKLYGKRLISSSDKWLARNYGAAPPSSSSSSMNVEKEGGGKRSCTPAGFQTREVDRKVTRPWFSREKMIDWFLS